MLFKLWHKQSPKTIKNNESTPKLDEEKKKNITTSITIVPTVSISNTILNSTTTTALCSPACLNGGTCVSSSNNTCQCIAEIWTGPQCQTPRRILWTFDNHLEDFYGNFPGVPVNDPTYRSPSIHGHGSCLYLNSSANQSVTIPSPPFLNMAYTSFSLTLWIQANTFRNACFGACCDNALFGQFDQISLRRSLHIIVRNRRIYFGFFNDDTQGMRILEPQVWYHMAYVYDYENRTQYVYVDGVLDRSNSLRGPYQGSAGDLTIGSNRICAPLNYFDGCIDDVAYVARAKSASEILTEATLTIWYNFENSLIDQGPLGINGTGTNIQYTILGRSGIGLNFSSSPSLVEGTGAVFLGTDGYSYSFSIWINPSVITSGTIIHLASSTSHSSWSFPILGFTNSGQLGAQGCSVNGSVRLIGSQINIGTWTHVAISYSQTTSLQLWINGTQIATSSSPFTSSTPDVPIVVTLGQSPNIAGICSSTNIVSGQYSGLMDEFQLYSRELSATDIRNLAYL